MAYAPVAYAFSGRNGVRIFQDAQLLTVEGVGVSLIATTNHIN